MALLGKVIKTVVKSSVLGMVENKAQSLDLSSIIQKKRDNQKNKPNAILTPEDQKNEIENVVSYFGTNIDVFNKQLSSLVEGTVQQISSYKSATEKRGKQSLLNSIDDNIKYMYLSKTFFSLLGNAALGMSLKEKQYLFIINFIPYFDGINVLSEEEYIESQKVDFTFEDFMGEYFNRKDRFEIPEVQTSIESFKSKFFRGNNQITNIPSVIAPNIETTNRRCLACNTPLEENSNFCPKCGAMQYPQILFCSKCGEKCDSSSSFCAYCGNPMK